MKLWKTLIGCVLACSALLSASGMAGAQVATAPLRYDVTSIKPHQPGDNMFFRTDPDSFSATGLTLLDLVRFAYGLDFSAAIEGVSGELKSARWDVHAKMDAETAAALGKLSGGERAAVRKSMLLALLQERFHLKARLETKDGPAYALMVAKGGPKLKEADPNDTYLNGVKGPDGKSHPGMMMSRAGGFTAQAVRMEDLARRLQGPLHRTVVDRTGLTGKYDIALKWSDDEGGGKDAGDDAAPSLFTALQEQLGLKLESTRAPAQLAIVEHAEPPTEN